MLRFRFVIVAFIIAILLVITLFNHTSYEFDFILQFRVPRALSALAVGSLLGLIGAVYQVFLRNPLASPYTLGVSGAAIFGANLFLLLAVPSFEIGAVLLAVLYSLFIFRINIEHQAGLILILFGIIASNFFAALALLLQYAMDPGQLFSVSRWLMGSLIVTQIYKPLVLLLTSFLLLLILIKKSHDFDLLEFGWDYAKTRGVKLKQIKLIIIISSVAVGIAVAWFGPIAFLGVIVPHFARFLLGYRAKDLFIGSFLIGAALLLLSDLVAKLLFYPFELPAGLVTGIFGAAILALIITRKG